VAALSLLVALACCSGSAGAAGTRLLRPDPALGGDGVVRPDPGPAFEGGLTYSTLSVEPDGSLLALREGGTCCRTKRGGPQPIHFTPTGRVDGRVEFPRLRAGAEARIVVRDPRGGWFRVVNTARLQRLEPDGRLDRGFDRFREKYESWGSEAAEFGIRRVLALASGEVLVAGAGRVARYLPDGTLDRGFGVDGEAFIGGTAPGSVMKIAGLLADGDRTIVLANSPGPDRTSRGPARAVALDPSGRIDPSFAAAAVPGPIVAFARRADGGVGLLWRPPPAPAAEPVRRFHLTVLGADGTPAPGFGGDGTVALGFVGLADPRTLLFLRDGGIAVGGEDLGTDGRCLVVPADLCVGVPVVLRLDAAGAPVPGFGTGGVARLAGLTSRSRTEPTPGGVLTLAEDGAGDLVAAGASEAGAFLARLGPSGAPVPGFGAAGTVVERRPLRSATGPISVARDSRGRILVATESDAGADQSGPTVFRYLPDGRPDRSFGEGGMVRFGPFSEAFELAPDSIGGTYVFEAATGEEEEWLTHLGAGGGVDRRFGTDGFVRLPLSPTPDHEVELNHLLATLPGGGLIVIGAGGSYHERFDYSGPLELRRLSSAGHPVRAFGHDGLRLLDEPRLHDFILRDLAPTAEGGVLVAGSIRERGGTNQLAVLKVLPDGRLDPRFGHRGLATLRVGAESSARVVLARPDGSVLVAAMYVTVGPEYLERRALLLRLGPDGSLARRFQGYRTHGYEAGYEARVLAHKMSDLVVAGGHVFLASRSGAGGSGATLLTYTLGGRCEGFVPFSPHVAESTVAITGTGHRLLLAAQRNDDWTEQDRRFTLRAFNVR
jgi:uncharacterized delta-60 repeat protein